MERKLMNTLSNAERIKLYEKRFADLSELMRANPFKKYRELEVISKGRFRKGWIAQQVHIRRV